MTILFSYNWRNLRVRWVTTLMTLFGLALVTLLFVSAFALGIGIERTLVGTGHPLNLIVLRPRATETQSFLSREQAGDIEALEGIARDASGSPLVSREVVVIANHPKRDGKKVNLAIRGVGPRGQELRGNIHVVEGRWFQPSVGEVVVGTGAHLRFRDMNVGDEPFIRGRRWKVVGIFAAGGQAYESELWADLSDVQAQFKRDLASLIVRCEKETDLERLIRFIKEDEQIRLDAKRHTDYYADQNSAAMMWKALAVVVALVLSIGAAFGAANTMFAAVATRTREIATMRVLGFRRLSIWTSFMAEAMLLGLSGGTLGAVAAFFAVDGMSAGTANWQTFTDLSFLIRVTPELMLTGALLSTLVAALGGFLPAWRASRVSVAAALRGL